MDIRGTNAALFFMVTLATLAMAAGCSSSETGGADTSSTGATTITTEDSPCATDPRGQHYAVGLSGASTDGSLKMSFVDASPAPPAEGENYWTLKVTDGSGAPLTGASFNVKPWMPDHLHGSSIVPEMTPMSEAGVYHVGILEFFMPGIWQTTFTLEQDSGPPEAVVFTFCISG
jgi:hypothetical protein